MNWEFALQPCNQSKPALIDAHPVRYWLTYALIIWILFFLNSAQIFARAEDNSSQLIAYLAQKEKINLTLAISETKLLTFPADQNDYLKQLQQNEALKALNRAKIASFESFLINQKKLQLDFNLHIKQLQQS